MTESNTQANVEVVTEQAIVEPTNPRLTFDDQFTNQVYQHSFDGVEHILNNVRFANDTTLQDIIGKDNLQQIAGFVMNDVVLTLVSALGDFHSTANTMMATTFKTVKEDLCLHKVSDVFLLQQSIIQLAVNANVFFNRHQFDEKYPDADGWSFNLLELNAEIARREEEAGIEYKDNEVPYRNEYVELVDIQGKQHPNCRFVNFTYTDSGTNEQIVTDIPAFWNDDINEYMFIPYILKWRFANKLPNTTADQDFSIDTVAKGFLAQTTETYEQVHQQRVAERQAALEAAEEERKKTEAVADAVEGRGQTSVVTPVDDGPFESSSSDSNSSSSDNSSNES